MGNKVVSTILFLILGPLYFILLLNFAFKVTLLNGQYLKKEFAEKSVYTKVIAGLDEMALKAETTPSEGIPTSEVAKAIRENLNPSDLQTIVEMALDGKKGTEIQKSVYGKVEGAIKAKYLALPVCKGTEDTACRPDGVNFEDMGKSNFMGIPVNVNEALAQTKTVTVASEKTFNWKAYLPYFFAFVLSVILVLLARLYAGDWKKIAFPTGLYLLIIGFFSWATAGFFLKLVIPQFIKTLPASKSAYFYNNLLVPLSNDILRDSRIWLNKTCLYLAVIGAIAIGFSIIMHFVAKSKSTND